VCQEVLNSFCLLFIKDTWDICTYGFKVLWISMTYVCDKQTPVCQWNSIEFRRQFIVQPAGKRSCNGKGGVRSNSFIAVYLCLSTRCGEMISLPASNSEVRDKTRKWVIASKEFRGVPQSLWKYRRGTYLTGLRQFISISFPIHYYYISTQIVSHLLLVLFDKPLTLMI
jgi:hypothetical protein